MQPMSLSPSLQRARSWMHVQRPCVLFPGLAVGVRRGGSQRGKCVVAVVVEVAVTMMVVVVMVVVVMVKGL
jgi:hypothetical protein